MRSEDVLGQKWDRCLSDTGIKFGKWDSNIAEDSRLLGRLVFDGGLWVIEPRALDSV